MKEIPLVDTLEVLEYSIKFDHNLPIEIPYDGLFDIQVIGCLVIIYLLYTL